MGHWQIRLFCMMKHYCKLFWKHRPWPTNNFEIAQDDNLEPLKWNLLLFPFESMSQRFSKDVPRPLIFQIFHHDIFSLIRYQYYWGTHLSTIIMESSNNKSPSLRYSLGYLPFIFRNQSVHYEGWNYNCNKIVFVILFTSFPSSGLVPIHQIQMHSGKNHLHANHS